MIYPHITEDYEVPLSPHFNLSEFRCKCYRRKLLYPGQYCHGAVHPNVVRLLEILEAVRSWVGRPVVISSGYRCEGYHSHLYKVINNKRRKDGLPMVVRPDGSAHLDGLGVDINVFFVKSDEGWLKSLGVTGVGYNIGRTESHTHLDIKHKRFTAWGYG